MQRQQYRKVVAPRVLSAFAQKKKHFRLLSEAECRYRQREAEVIRRQKQAMNAKFDQDLADWLSSPWYIRLLTFKPYRPHPVE